MSKSAKMACALAGLISLQVATAFAGGIPNDAIPQANFKIQGGAGYSIGHPGFIVPGVWYGTPVAYAPSVYVPPPAVAAGNRQGYQSFSYEPGAPVAAAPLMYYPPSVYGPTLPRAWDPLYFNTPPKFYDANRKITGKDWGY